MTLPSLSVAGQDPIQAALLRVILASLLGLILLGGISFWVTPAYVQGVAGCQETLKEILIASLVGKVGIAMPGKS